MSAMMMTTGSGFDGYHVTQYCGLISKDVILKNNPERSADLSSDDPSDPVGPRTAEAKEVEQLIEKGKQNLVTQVESETTSRGANALIGAAFDSFIGTDIIRVSMTGTAVVIEENKYRYQPAALLNGTPLSNETSASDDTPASDFPKTINITESNMISPFIPSALFCDHKDGRLSIALMAQLRTERLYGDVLADVTFVNLFEETYTVTNCCFLNFVCAQRSRIKSAGYPVEIPEYVSCCLKSCKITVKKYMCNDHIHTVYGNKTYNTKEESEKLFDHSKTSVSRIIKELRQCETAMDMLNCYNEIEHSIPVVYRTKLKAALKRRVMLEKMYGVDKITAMEVIKKIFNNQ